MILNKCNNSCIKSSLAMFCFIITHMLFKFVWWIWHWAIYCKLLTVYSILLEDLKGNQEDKNYYWLLTQYWCLFLWSIRVPILNTSAKYGEVRVSIREGSQLKVTLLRFKIQLIIGNWKCTFILLKDVRSNDI